MKRTSHQWLGLGDDLAVELAKVLPGLSKIDWNTAMEWRDKTDYGRFEYELNEVWKPLTDFDDCFYDSYDLWKDTKASPKHYLIAAAMAAGGSIND